VIRGFLLLGNREYLSFQITHDWANYTNGSGIAFHGKGHIRERWAGAVHECHQWMQRCDSRPASPQHIQFVAGQSAAGVQRYLSSPVGERDQNTSRVCNFAVWDTKPDDMGIELSIVLGRRASIRLAGQLTPFSLRGPALTSDDLANSISRPAQRYS